MEILEIQHKNLITFFYNIQMTIEKGNEACVLY